MAEQPVSLKEKVSFGLGAVGKDMAYALMAVYVMVYFTDVVGVSGAFVGFVFLIARIWDAINDPIMGWIIDNTKTRWGKFRPWILIGTLINAVVATIMFTNPVEFFGFEPGGWGVKLYVAISYIAWGMTYTAMDVPYWSSIVAYGSDAKTRNIMSVIPRTGAMIGGQFVTIFGLGLIALFATMSGGNNSDGYLWFSIFVGVFFVLTEIICVKNTYEHVQTPLRQKISASGMLQLLAKNDQLLVIIVLTVIHQIAANLVNGTIIYYFKYVIINEGVYPVFMACGAICQFLAYITFPYLVAKTSRRFMYVASISLMIIGYVIMFMAVDPVPLFVAGLGYCLASFGMAVSLVLTTVMLADTVEYGEYKLGTRSEAIVFSMQTMTVKFGSALAGLTTGLTLTLVGYVPNVEQTPEVLLSLRIIMFGCSSVLLAVIVFLYLKYYRLNGEFYENILSALQVSRDQALAKKEGERYVRATLEQDAIMLDCNITSKNDLLSAMVDKLVQVGRLEQKDAKAFLDQILAREAQAPTGIADGIAIPHAKSDLIKKSALVIAKLRTPMDFQAPDNKDCDLIFLLASVNDGNAHLNVIGRLGLILNDPKNVQKIRDCDDAYNLVEIIAQAEKEQIKFVKAN